MTASCNLRWDGREGAWLSLCSGCRNGRAFIFRRILQKLQNFIFRQTYRKV